MSKAAAVMCILALGALPSQGVINRAEVKSFATLVNDRFEDSGGYSPALSPDGKTLAFFAGRSLWLLHGVDADDASERVPWKLESPILPSNSYCPDSRQIDWAPDGKRLAFRYSDGNLYAADGLDFEARTVASVRLLAGPKNENDPGLTSLCHPRWSPDGTRIALLRDMSPGFKRAISVVNVDSGEETVLARDAYWEDWNQPWSPDGKLIAYEKYGGKVNEREEDGVKISESFRLGISTVSMDGREHRLAIKDRYASSPSWSPLSNRLAFSGSRKYTLDYPSGKVSETGSAIWVADPDGTSRKLASSPRVPTREELALIEAESQKRIRAKFQKQFAPVLTFEQSVRFRQGKLSEDEMLEIAMLVAARGIGGEFQRRIETILGAPGKTDDSAILRAVLDLPGHQREQFMSKWLDIWIESAPFVGPGHDTCPVWSPDGRRIAFVRKKDDLEHLHVVDLAAGRERELVSSDRIRCITWGADGRSLVCQSTREMAKVPSGEDSTMTFLGNCEIWRVELK